MYYSRVISCFALLSCIASKLEVILTQYRVGQNDSCMNMFEYPTFLLPTNLGQPMHSPPALMEHVSLNLEGTFLLNPVEDTHLSHDVLSCSISERCHHHWHGTWKGGLFFCSTFDVGVALRGCVS